MGISSLEQNAKILCDFGLTLNQAKVYVTIVKLGSVQVGEIAKHAQVRREDIYRALPRLEELGLIEKSLGAPVKIHALPLEETLHMLIKRRQDEVSKKMSQLNASADEFLRQYKTHQREPEKESEEAALFSLITGREPVSAKVSTLIKNSRKQIDIVSTRDSLARFLHMNSDLFKKAGRSGVTIRVVTETPREEDPIRKLIKQNISPAREVIDLRHIDSLPGHYMIFDAKEALISASAKVGISESSSLYTKNSGLVEVLQKNFGDVWFFASMPRTIIEPETMAKTRKHTKQVTD